MDWGFYRYGEIRGARLKETTLAVSALRERWEFSAA